MHRLSRAQRRGGVQRQFYFPSIGSNPGKAAEQTVPVEGPRAESADGQCAGLGRAPFPRGHFCPDPLRSPGGFARVSMRLERRGGSGQGHAGVSHCVAGEIITPHGWI